MPAVNRNGSVLLKETVLTALVLQPMNWFADSLELSLQRSVISTCD